jgi:tungstate transport system ATP-binding protein
VRAAVSDLPIVLEDVSVRSGDVTIVDRMSLDLAAGAPTVLIGPNGAGKSSLIRLAMGLLSPTGGRVTWGGRAQALGGRRSIVFQRPVMLRRTAGRNVAYALAAAGMERGRRAARIADLLDRVGLQGLGERPARRLSAGEQQRLALARALACDPEILLLDEPTASLDPASTKAVEDIVRSAAGGGVKIVMATHDLGQARRLGGEIVFLVRGRIVERAPAERFFRSPDRPESAAFLQGDLLI